MNRSGVLFVTIIENKRIESMSVSIFRLPFHLKSAINFTLNVLLYSCLPSWWNCGFVKYLTCVFSNGTIILEVITCKKILLQKLFEWGIPFNFDIRGLVQTKISNISHYQITDLLEIWNLFVSAKGQTRDKSEFVIKFVGVIVTIIFV